MYGVSGICVGNLFMSCKSSLREDYKSNAISWHFVLVIGFAERKLCLHVIPTFLPT